MIDTISPYPYFNPIGLIVTKLLTAMSIMERS